MTATGTIASVVTELSKVLRPLETELRSTEGSRGFFLQLGFSLTNSQLTAVAAPLSDVAGNVGDLVRLIGAILAAADAEDYGTVAAKSVEAVQRLVEAIGAIDELSAGLSGAVGLPAGEVAKRLFDFLIFTYLQATPEVNDFLEILGLLERDERDEDSEDPEHPPYTQVSYRFDHVGDWFEDPMGRAEALYDWGAGFDGHKAFGLVERVTARAGLPVFYDDSGPTARLDLVVLEAVPKTDVNPPGLLIRLKHALSSGLQTIPLSNDVQVELKIDFQVPGDTGIAILPSGDISVIAGAGGGTFRGEILARVIAKRTQPPEPFLLFGDAGGSRLELASFTGTLGAVITAQSGNATGGGLVEARMDDLKVVIDTTNADGFLGKVLPGTHIEAAFSSKLGLSSEDGFYFEGSGALEVRLPLHLQLGPIEIPALTLAAKLAGGELPTSVGLDIKANLGPLQAVVENIGVTATFSFPEGNGGNLGPLDFSLGFKPPNGVGLSLDVGVVKGGGYLFFDFDREEYAGVLELSLAGIVTVKAIGLITTKMPDGSKGFSLLLIITAEFGTGIQLGFGFTLLGVGGLVGLNRTMNLQPLLDGVRTGSVNSIMFPENPVANAPRIIADLRAIFPPLEGRFLIGPMVKIGWGTPTLVSVSVGVIIEITGNIAIVGVLKVALPAPEAPLIVIQVAFVGAIEFDKQRLYFFASMFDSRIVFLTLEGELGLLVAWGDDANFVLSVGGFHPRFSAPALPFPSPKRIAVSLLNTAIARIRTETYFAVTSNTVQFGASTELMFDVGVASVEGHMSFDALFQFSPFYFIVEISASVSLKVFGLGLFSIHLDFALEGPTPYRAHGTGTLSLFFFDVSADFDVTWGDSQDTTLPPIPVMPLLRGELEKLENWTVRLPTNNHLLVSLRKLPETESPHVLHPLGQLKVSQRAVPLNLKIDKVGSQKPSDANSYTLKAVSGLAKVDDADESFAKAQFLNMSDAEKLSQRAFDPLDGGIILSSGGQELGAAKLAKRRVRYEQEIIDSNYLRFRRRYVRVAHGLFMHFVKASAVSKSPLSNHQQTLRDPYTEKVKVVEGTYTVAFSENNRPYSEAARTFASEAQAQQFLRERTAAEPSLHDALHVIPHHEAT
jgi:hypothetical protein